MKIEESIIKDFIHHFFRLTNKFNQLEKQPLDFGTGDLLYPVEIHTIEAIKKYKAETVTDLSSLFGVTKGAVSQTVKKLTAKGYIKKVRNPDFTKEIIITLTEKGQTAFENHGKFHEMMDYGFIQRLGDISENQVETFKSILDQIENHIDFYLKEGGKS